MPNFIILRRVPLMRAQAMQRELEREWMGRWGRSRATTLWRPQADVHEIGDHYAIKIELAGMRDAEIEVLFDDGQLVVRGNRPERRTSDLAYIHELGINYGPFQIEFSLPTQIREDAIEARYDDGMLVITLPKRPLVREEPRRITVQVDESSLTPQ